MALVRWEPVRELTSLQNEMTRLTVSGEREAEHEDKREGYVRVERSYGAFRRPLALPEGVDPERVTASVDNGGLEVRIPKPGERKPRRVAIQVGKGPAAIEGDEAA
jgi:HSP20 family protein